MQIRNRIKELRQMEKEEVWRSVPMTEGYYEASTYGRIRRAIPSRGAKPGRIMAQRANNSGYLLVMLWIKNKATCRLAHRLVADAFLGPLSDQIEVNHIDCCKTNNRIENLELVTRSENLHHASETYGAYRGKRNAQTKLNEQQVRDIRSLHSSSGLGYKKIGKMFGVSWGAIRDIIKRHSWAWVEEAV